MAKPFLPEADNRALAETPFQFRERKLAKLLREERHYKNGVVISAVVSLAMLVLSSLLGGLLLWVITIGATINVVYMYYKQLGTRKSYERLRDKHELSKTQRNVAGSSASRS